jgi:hypothetical protein
LSLPVNVLTAVIGAPYVAYLMLRQRWFLFNTHKSGIKLHWLTSRN